MNEEMFYGTLPPDTQDFRQVLSGIARTIRDRAMATGKEIIESGQRARELQAQAFANPQRPTQVTNPQALQQLTDMIMAGPMGFAPAGITAYHGSPYLFRQFDPAKVGAGEGAQAYGVGAGYTAEARPIAEWYRSVLAGKEQDIINNAISRVVNVGNKDITKIRDSLILEGFPKEKITLELEKSIKKIVQGTDPKDGSISSSAIREYDVLKKLVPKTGYLYKGDIPDEILPRFLDLDKPISKQPNVMDALRSEAKQRVRGQKLIELENEIRKAVPPKDIGDDFLAMFSESNISKNQEIQKQALDKLNKMDLSFLINKEMDALKPKDINWNMTGKEFYEYLAKTQGSADQASALLERQGLRGIRYLDQDSRSAGKGTYNFIPFRPEDFKIQEINDIPIQQYIEQGLL